MKPSFFPTTAHVLLCTGPSCQERGADVLFRALWQSLERERLAYYAGGGLRFTQSGCLGACHFGPNIACHKQGATKNGTQAWYFGMTYPLALELCNNLQTGTNDSAELAQQRYDQPL